MAERQTIPQGQFPATVARLHDLDEHIAPLPKGHVLGAYEIQGMLGVGGFGITYRAQDRKLNYTVALKEYLPAEFALRTQGVLVEARSPVLRDVFAWGKSRFLEEARTLARFKHPNIVRVLSFFEANNTAYFAMDFEQGQNLNRLLHARGSLEEDELNELLQPLCDGLEALHAKGFIHRDVKPGNIYVRTGGEPVLLDFGAALRPEEPLAEVGRTLLTPGYAPPEQYDRKAVLGPWTDIYGLAAVAYRALSGMKPVESVVRKAALGQGQQDPMPSAVEQGKERYGALLLEAVDAGLTVDKEARPQSVRAWREMFHAGARFKPRKRKIHLGRVPPGAVGGGLERFKRVLLAVADAEHARVDSVLLQTLLSLQVRHATHGAEAITQMQQGRTDAILCDSRLADMDAADFLQGSARKLLWNRPPVILLHQETADREMLVRGIALGAQAFVQRPYAVEDMEGAFKRISRMSRAYSVEEAMLAEAATCVAQGRYGRAMRLQQDVLSIEEESHELGEPGYVATSWQGMRELAGGEYVAAMESLARATGMLALLVEAQGNLAEVQRKTGDMEGYADSAKNAATCATRFERMLERRLRLVELLLQTPRAGNPLNELGVRLRREGDHAGALGAFLQAVHLSPREAAIYYNLARVQAHLRRKAAARANLETALRLAPDFEPAAKLLQHLESEAGKEAETS